MSFLKMKISSFHYLFVSLSFSTRALHLKGELPLSREILWYSVRLYIRILGAVSFSPSLNVALFTFNTDQLRSLKAQSIIGYMQVTNFKSDEVFAFMFVSRMLHSVCDDQGLNFRKKVPQPRKVLLKNVKSRAKNIRIFHSIS